MSHAQSTWSSFCCPWLNFSCSVMSGSPLSSQAGTLSRSLAVFSQFLPLSIGSACLHRALHWLHWIPLECLCLIIIDTDPAFCCNLERCSLTASLISWTSPVAHYAVCNITYIANCVTRAPLLYFIRSWVALSFKVVCQASVTPVQISTFCNI